jgi:alpha-glucosidase (family GH31 glycosyl hydrolase)
MRKAMRQKYNLIRYFYTQYSNIAKEGGVFFKPMYFDNDFSVLDEAYHTANIENDFLLGSALKASVPSKLN